MTPVDPFDLKKHTHPFYSDVFNGNSAVNINVNLNDSISSLKSPEPASESIKAALPSSKGIISFFMDLFGWNKQSTDGVKSQESPDKVGEVGGRPKLSPPEESAKQVDFFSKELKRSTQERVQGIEEEFDASRDPKYAEALITKWLINIINTNRANHEKGSLIAAQQVEEFQETIAERQKQRSEIAEKIAQMAKNNEIHAKLTPIFQGGTLAGLAITGVLLFTGAATIASGGTLAPLLIAANIFMGASAAMQAGNGFMKNWNDIAIEKNSGISLQINEEKNMIQFEIKLNLDKVKEAMQNVTANIDESKKILDMQQEALSIFRT